MHEITDFNKEKKKNKNQNKIKKIELNTDLNVILLNINEIKSDINKKLSKNSLIQLR